MRDTFNNTCLPQVFITIVMAAFMALPINASAGASSSIDLPSRPTSISFNSTFRRRGANSPKSRWVSSYLIRNLLRSTSNFENRSDEELQDLAHKLLEAGFSYDIDFFSFCPYANCSPDQVKRIFIFGELESNKHQRPSHLDKAREFISSLGVTLRTSVIPSQRTQQTSVVARIRSYFRPENHRIMHSDVNAGRPGQISLKANSLNYIKTLGRELIFKNHNPFTSEVSEEAADNTRISASGDQFELSADLVDFQREENRAINIDIEETIEREQQGLTEELVKTSFQYFDASNIGFVIVDKPMAERLRRSFIRSIRHNPSAHTIDSYPVARGASLDRR